MRMSDRFRNLKSRRFSEPGLCCVPARVAAQPRFIHAYSGTSSAQLAIWAAKDLGLFAKYGLDADLVFISGSARAMQALLGGSIQAADSDGIGPINAIQRGGDAVIVAGLINKSFFSSSHRKRSPRLPSCVTNASA